MIVRDPAVAALVGQPADRAMRYRLRIGHDRRLGGNVLEAANDVPVQSAIPVQLDCDRRAVAQHKMCDSRIELLNVGEEAVVQAELVNDLRLDLPSELRIEHLVRVLAEPGHHGNAA